LKSLAFLERWVSSFATFFSCVRVDRLRTVRVLRLRLDLERRFRLLFEWERLSLSSLELLLESDGSPSGGMADNGIGNVGTLDRSCWSPEPRSGPSVELAHFSIRSCS
jgi:hypothetical protein